MNKGHQKQSSILSASKFRQIGKRSNITYDQLLLDAKDIMLKNPSTLWHRLQSLWRKTKNILIIMGEYMIRRLYKHKIDFQTAAQYTQIAQGHLSGIRNQAIVVFVSYIVVVILAIIALFPLIGHFQNCYILKICWTDHLAQSIVWIAGGLTILVSLWAVDRYRLSFQEYNNKHGLLLQALSAYTYTKAPNKSGSVEDAIRTLHDLHQQLEIKR